jgi:hypothetical protein
LKRRTEKRRATRPPGTGRRYRVPRRADTLRSTDPLADDNTFHLGGSLFSAMDETVLCSQCHGVIDLRPKSRQRWVVMNRDTARNERQRLYAHLRCGQAALRAADKLKLATLPDAESTRRLHREMLEKITPATRQMIMGKKSTRKKRGR